MNTVKFDLLKKAVSGAYAAIWCIAVSNRRVAALDMSSAS
jgi:hypothetical protein